MAETRTNAEIASQLETARDWLYHDVVSEREVYALLDAAAVALRSACEQAARDAQSLAIVRAILHPAHKCTGDGERTYVLSPCRCPRPRCEPIVRVVLDVGREHKERDCQSIVGWKTTRIKRNKGTDGGIPVSDTVTRSIVRLAALLAALLIASPVVAHSVPDLDRTLRPGDHYTLRFVAYRVCYVHLPEAWSGAIYFSDSSDLRTWQPLFPTYSEYQRIEGYGLVEAFVPVDAMVPALRGGFAR